MTSPPSSMCVYSAASPTPAPCTRARPWGSLPSSLLPASSTPSRTQSGARGRTPGSLPTSTSTPRQQRRGFVSDAKISFLPTFRHFHPPERSSRGESKFNFLNSCNRIYLNFSREIVLFLT